MTIQYACIAQGTKVLVSAGKADKSTIQNVLSRIPRREKKSYASEEYQHPPQDFP